MFVVLLNQTFKENVLIVVSVLNSATSVNVGINITGLVLCSTSGLFKIPLQHSSDGDLCGPTTNQGKPQKWPLKWLCVHTEMTSVFY